MLAQHDRVTIGRIERPFGVKGAVKVRSLSDVPGRFDHLGMVSVVAMTGEASDRTVKHVRRAGPDYILEFADVTTPEEARLLRGGLIQIPRQENLPRSRDVFYECDLIGMTVVDEQGADLGVVESTWELPGHHLLVVRQGKRELLIPAAKDFVKSVDTVQRRMVVNLLEGMVEEHDAL